MMLPMPRASQHSKYLSSAGDAFQLVIQVFNSGDESTRLSGSSSDNIAPSDVIRLNTGLMPVSLKNKYLVQLKTIVCNKIMYQIFVCYFCYIVLRLHSKNLQVQLLIIDI